MTEEKTHEYEPIRWSDDNLVMFVDGWAWANELVEKEAKPPEVRRWEVVPICLGRKDDIIPMISGEKSIPDDMSPERVAVIRRIQEASEHVRTLDTRTNSLERSRSPRSIGHSAKNARLSKSRKRLPRGEAHLKVKGVSRR